MLRTLSPIAAGPHEPVAGLYRSEAFAEDLQELVRPLPQWQRGVPPAGPRATMAGDDEAGQCVQIGSGWAVAAQRRASPLASALAGGAPGRFGADVRGGLHAGRADGRAAGAHAGASGQGA
jgi:hypothetical protein